MIAYLSLKVYEKQFSLATGYLHFAGTKSKKKETQSFNILIINSHQGLFIFPNTFCNCDETLLFEKKVIFSDMQ